VALLEVCVAIQWAALLGAECGDAGGPGALLPVVIGGVGGECFGVALDTDLATDVVPPKAQRDSWITGDVLAFLGLAIGAEDETVLIEVFEIDKATGRKAFGIDGTEAKGAVVFQRCVVLGLVPPLMELV